MLQCLSAVNSNMEIEMSIQISICMYFKKILKVKLLDHMMFLFATFQGASTLFSVVAASIYFSSTVHKCSFFFTFSPTLIISCLFDDSYLTDVRRYLIAFLIFISLVISDAEHLFMYSWPSVCVLCCCCLVASVVSDSATYGL